MTFGIFDQDVSKLETFRNVERYKLGRQQYYLNNKTFLLWFFAGILHGGILLLFSMLLFSNNVVAKLTQVKHSRFILLLMRFFDAANFDLFHWTLYLYYGFNNGEFKIINGNLYDNLDTRCCRFL
jgi:hypothetical protein